jgi:hypothetical protein
MVGKLEAVKNSLHLLIASVHPNGEVCHAYIHFGKPDFHMGHTRFEVADPASDLTDVGFQLCNIVLDTPQDLKDELARWFGHGLPYR